MAGESVERVRWSLGRKLGGWLAGRLIGGSGGRMYICREQGVRCIDLLRQPPQVPWPPAASVPGPAGAETSVLVHLPRGPLSHPPTCPPTVHPFHHMRLPSTVLTQVPCPPTAQEQSPGGRGGRSKNVLISMRPALAPQPAPPPDIWQLLLCTSLPSHPPATQPAPHP